MSGWNVVEVQHNARCQGCMVPPIQHFCCLQGDHWLLWKIKVKVHEKKIVNSKNRKRKRSAGKSKELRHPKRIGRSEGSRIYRAGFHNLRQQHDRCCDVIVSVQCLYPPTEDAVRVGHITSSYGIPPGLRAYPSSVLPVDMRLQGRFIVHVVHVDYSRKQTSHSHLWQKSRHLQKCGGDHIVVKTTGQHLFLLRELWMGNCTRKDFLALKTVGHLAEGTIGTTHPKSEEDSWTAPPPTWSLSLLPAPLSVALLPPEN